MRSYYQRLIWGEMLARTEYGAERKKGELMKEMQRVRF